MDKIKTPNEVQRIAVRDILIQNGPNHYEAGNQLWAYREDGKSWEPICDSLQRPYSIIAKLCSSRAIEVENTNILCNGRHIRAEDYLGIWRENSKASITNAELMSRGGYITITIKKQRAEFEARVHKQGTPEQVDLLKRSDCVIDGPTAVWTIKLVSMDSLRAYEQITDVYCHAPEQPGENSVTASLYMPEKQLACTEMASTLKVVATVHDQFELEM